MIYLQNHRHNGDAGHNKPHSAHESDLPNSYKHHAKVDPNLLKKEITLADSQVKAKFNKHAEDFGIQGNYNKQNHELFKQKLMEHVTNKDTISIAGTHRGTENVVRHFNPKTGLNVIKGTNEKFISGWKLYPSQIIDLKTNGNVRCLVQYIKISVYIIS